jgi:chromosome segregation ATPase
MQQLMGELQLSAELTAQIQRMQTELLSSQEKVDTLSLNIEQGNEQYFILKKRYDALDIEYAQLFEKFSAAEEMMNKGK